MNLESAFGLPAHPLLAHAPIVLIPLTLILAIVTVAWRRYTRPLSLVLLGLSFVTAGAAFLAAESGEKLQRRLPNGEDAAIVNHASLGGTVKLLAILTFLVIAVYTARIWADRLRVRPDSSLGRVIAAPWVGVVLAVAVLGLSTFSTVWTVRAGHTGAEAVWKKKWDTLPPAPVRTGGD